MRLFLLVARAGATQTGAMAQLQLPVFAEGVTQLSSDLGVCCREGRVSYFYGMLPVFAHDAKDLKSFQLTKVNTQTRLL